MSLKMEVNVREFINVVKSGYHCLIISRDHGHNMFPLTVPIEILSGKSHPMSPLSYTKSGLFAECIQIYWYNPMKFRNIEKRNKYSERQQMHHHITFIKKC